MTIVSDNTATNMLIELTGVEPVNDRMRSLGLPLTTLYRKSYTPDTEASKPYGLGMTTPSEMAELLVQIAEGKVANPEVSRRYPRDSRGPDASRLDPALAAVRLEVCRQDGWN